MSIIFILFSFSVGSASAFSIHLENGSLKVEGGWGDWLKRPPQPPTAPLASADENRINASLIIRNSDPTRQATEQLSGLGWPGNTSFAWEQHQIDRAPLQEKIRMMGIGGTAVWYIRRLFGW